MSNIIGTQVRLLIKLSDTSHFNPQSFCIDTRASWAIERSEFLPRGEKEVPRVGYADINAPSLCLSIV